MKRLIAVAGILLLAIAVRASLTGQSGSASSFFGILSATTEPTSTSFDPPTLKLMRGHAGYWRLGQDASGVWWFVSPAGKPDFLNTVTTVQPFQHGRDSNGPYYISSDWKGSPTNTSDLNHWATATLARVHNIGFKGLGAWCHPIFHNYDVPMTRDLNVWDWVGSGSKRLYSPDWAPSAEVAIKSQCELLRDNKNLIGYYSDNELDWGDDACGPYVYFDHLPKTDPNRLQVLAVIQSTWPDLAQFNKDWHTSITDWKDLQTWDQLPKEQQPKAYTKLFSAWLGHLAGDYYHITTDLIKKYDPNHLILGVRYRGYAPPEVVQSARGLTDAQSINYYVGDARLDLDQFQMMYQAADQPVIVSEYSFHSLDGRSGDRNLVGFAAQVLDQQARADGYRLMTTRLARIPYVLGADWFQWMDEPPSGRSSDGEDVNFGIVDIDDRPYEALVSAISATTPLLNPLHKRSATDPQQDVWRESFATKPVAHIPFLTEAPRINGELGDWPEQAKIHGIRHSQTVGLDRSSLPLPNVYIGWNYTGLFIGMEVFDNDIESAPAKGWWWTKDNVELWISTHPVPPDQNTYDANCQQFFYVPNDATSATTANGIVGQWHRSGDAISDNLVPHPSIIQASRLLPDRYVVEMFIPAKALHGWDPQKDPTMAFNIHVRNFQHAMDYFWSAPKEVMTQLRPNTWGTLALQPPPIQPTPN